jgi:hypothetical protein
MLDWLKKLFKGRQPVPPPPKPRMYPLILRNEEASTPEVPISELRNFELTSDFEPALNYALRVVAEGMASEGIITKRQSRDFVGAHALVVASKERGLAALLRTIRTPEESIKANHSRVVLMRLPTTAHDE